MGVQNVKNGRDASSAAFRQALLTDLQAFEEMLDRDLLESDIVRIGAEQEMLLVDSKCRPAPVASQVLDLLADNTFAPEIGKFNLEANIQPQPVAGSSLRHLDADLTSVVQRASSAAQQCGANILLTGILPSVRLSDLGLHNLTDRPRYHELNRSVMLLRGGAYHLLIKGVDELQFIHQNVMLEACCTSFQVHVQLDPKTFAPDYNASLLAAAPVLAVAANSPILIGRRLWQETRIALFQHAVDERSHSDIARSHPTRVSFGEAWVENSAVEIYREQIARFRDIMTSDITENSLATLASGGIPQLKALGLHNSTVWRWNRPCFGITEGRPHLRLEFRALPAGPTVLDEVANVALFLGLMKSLPEEYGNVSRRMQFEDAKDNFFAAARHGLKAQLTWVDGKHYATGDLMQRHLIPLAEKGLAAFDIDSEDIERYLGVIRGRLDADQTGSKWSLCAASALSKGASPEGRDRRVVAAMLKRQQSSLPVHQWPAVTNEEIDGLEDIGETVGEIMTTDVFTVKPDDPISLAASLMDWRHIRHLPVEHNGKLVGLVSSRDVSHALTAPNQSNGDSPGNTIAQIMRGEPLTVSSETPLRTAVKLMLDQHLDCLPVSDGDELIGIVTSKDLLRVLFMILSHSQGRN